MVCERGVFKRGEKGECVCDRGELRREKTFFKNVEL